MSIPLSSREAFAIAVVPDRSEVAVVPSGDLDLASVDVLDREIRELRRAGFDHLVVDLRRLRLIDSSGLRLLLSLRNDARRDGQSLTLVAGSAEVQRVFRLTATRHLFDWR